MPIKKASSFSMTKTKSIRIRNLKEGDWYWIARKVLRSYGKKLGPSGIAVYNALACFSDTKTQGCFPTRKTVAHILGLSRKTVSRKIELLKKLHLISVEKAGISYRYFLLEAPTEETDETPAVDNRDTLQGTLWLTNNNQLSRVNTNRKPKKKITKTSQCFALKNKEELMASDLATELCDRENINFYLFLAKKHPEQLLRRILGEVKEVPDNKIKKGRAALFKFLIQKHARRTFKNPGD